MIEKEIDIKAIIDLCHLKNLTPVETGWRAETVYDSPPDPSKSLWISSGGGFKCHRSQTTGHVVQLYAKCTGKKYVIARADLRKHDLVPRDFEIIDPNPLPDDSKLKIGTILENLKTDVNWDVTAKWRGIPEAMFLDTARFGNIGYVSAYAAMGSAYAFISTNPPIEGLNNETKGIMLRSTIPQNKGWITVSAYPIWCSSWNKDAKEVWLVEGQWDAMALQVALNGYANEDVQRKIQVLALCGSKNIEKYPEIMEYFKGKRIVQVPDRDEQAGEKIFIRTAETLEKIDCTHNLARIPKGMGKDFNDWLKKGVSREDFNLWISSPDTFRVSNGVVIDSDFRMKHGLKIDSMVEIDPDGKPVEIYQRKLDTEDYINGSKLMDILKPFPILYEYVKECSTVSEAPVLWHAMSFMTYISALVGRRLKLESGAVGVLYPMLYTLLVGPSSIGKSECMYMLRSIVGRANPDLFCGESFSAESLFDEFSVNPQKMLVINEFSEWLGASESSYRNYAMKAFMKMYDAHQYTEDNPFRMNFRTKGKSVTISEPALAIMAACTPEQIMTNEDNLKGGIVGRFIYCIGRNRQSDIPIPGRIPHLLRDKIEKMFRGILTTPNRINSYMRFHPNAYRLYESSFKRHRDHEKKITNGDDNMMTYSGRWRVRVFKIAMILELLKEDVDWPLVNSDIIITEESLIAAMKIVRVLDKSFFELFEKQFTTDSSTFSSKIQHRIIKYMREKSGLNGHQVTHSELARFMKLNSKELKDSVNSLIESGDLFKKEIRNGAHRPTTIYLLAKPKEDYDITFPD